MLLIFFKVIFKIYKSVRKIVIAFHIILIKLVKNKNKHDSGGRDMNVIGFTFTESKKNSETTRTESI